LVRGGHRAGDLLLETTLGLVPELDLMPTAAMSSGGGKMKGVVKKTGREKKTTAMMRSGVAKIKKGSDRKNAAASRSKIGLMMIVARKRLGTPSAWCVSELFGRRGDVKKRSFATEIVGLIFRRCRRGKL
jgi:hypothetical protein